MNTITIGYAEEPIRIGSFAFYNYYGSSIIINREVYFEDNYGARSESVFAVMPNITKLILPNTVGKNTAKIKEYIAKQLKEDKEIEQMTITELIDPFKK